MTAMIPHIVRVALLEQFYRLPFADVSVDPYIGRVGQAASGLGGNQEVSSPQIGTRKSNIYIKSTNSSQGKRGWCALRRWKYVL